MMKFFKYLILIILYLIFSGYKPLDFYYLDKPIIEKYIDSLKNKGVNEFIILSTPYSFIDINNTKLYLNFKLSLQFIVDSTYSEQDMSFLFWREKGNSFFICISNNAIYKRQIISNCIFEYKNKDRTWLTDDENTFKVVAPIQEPLGKIILINIKNDKTRFFEIGENVEFDLNPNKKVYRAKWLDLIIKNLNYQTRDWQISEKNKSEW